MTAKKEMAFVSQSGKVLPYRKGLASVLKQREYFEQNGLMEQLEEQVVVLTKALDSEYKSLKPPASFIELVAQDRVFREFTHNVKTSVPDRSCWINKVEPLETFHWLMETDSDGMEVCHAMKEPSIFTNIKFWNVPKTWYNRMRYKPLV